MTRAWYDAPPSDAGRGLDLVRIGSALVLAVHPLHGLWSGGHWGADITAFGGFFTSLGLPAGTALAWTVILVQSLGVAALQARRFVVPACLALIAVLAAGVWTLHRHEGWFVVGAGRNGMEFSVLLILCYAGVMWAHWPRKADLDAAS